MTGPTLTRPPGADPPSGARPRVRRVVTGRPGGASAPPYDTFNLAAHVGDDPAAVHANRARLARATGRPVTDLVWMVPVHGARVVRVRRDGPREIPDCDAVLTTEPGLVLAALSADCVPVLLADPRAGVVAAVHAGREGVRLGVVPAAVRAMTSLGAATGRIEALLGPAICGRHYEVPPGVQRTVEAAAPGSAVPTATGSAGLDLRAGLDGQLRALGVRTVVHDARCTYEDPGLFSHRRDGVTGRHAAVVWLGAGP